MEPTEEVRAMARSMKRQLETLKVWGLREVPQGRAQSSANAKAIALSRLEQEVSACIRCPLYRIRTHPVVGEGNLEARLVFIGEAPGREEDLQGRPFVGAAGQLLTKMIEAIGLRREAVYICNVLKDRPPNNRTPLPEEVEACRPYLLQQLQIIHPTVICTLGAVAVKTLLGPTISITQVRGQLRSYEQIPVIPTFHPAYLLRNPSAKRAVWQDLKTVKALLMKTDRPPSTVDSPQ